MRFKSIGFLAAMAGMLTTLTGCDVEVTNKSTTPTKLDVLIDRHTDGCVSTEGVQREMTDAGCLHTMDAMFVLVPSVKDKIEKALKDEDLTLDDADITINSVAITATASRFVGPQPLQAVGASTIDVTANGARVLSLSAPSLSLAQPVTVQLPKPLLDQVAKAAKSGMPITGTATVTFIADPNTEGGTLTVDLTVAVDATASVSIWAKIF